MPTINAADSVRYLTRLFGYFLGLAVFGGGATGGGIYLLRRTGAMPGGQPVEVGAELAGGIVLTSTGILLLLAGFFVIVLNVVADGVRLGVNATQSAPAEPTSQQLPAEQSQFAPSTAGQAASADGQDQDHPSEEPPAVESDEEDERWKQEVEQKLESEQRGRTPPGERGVPEGDSVAERATPESTEPQQTGQQAEAGASQEPMADEQPAPGVTERRDTAPAERSDAGPRERPVSRPAEQADADVEDEPAAAAPDQDAETDEWVSGEEVRESDADTPTAASSTQPGEEAFDTDEPMSDAGGELRDDAASEDDPLAPDDIEPTDERESDPFEAMRTEDDDEADSG